MEDKFKELNRFNKEMTESSAPLLGTFSGAIFKNAPWFLSTIKLKISKFKQQEVKIDGETEPSLQLEEEKIVSEKDQVVNSLYEYTKKEVETNNTPVKIEGDRRTLTTTGPTLKHESDFSHDDLKNSMSGYLLELETCNKCFKESNEEVCQYIDSKMHTMKLENIDVLFVGDSPKKEGQGILDTFTSDSGEIVKRMIGAMKLREDKWAITNISKCFKEDLDYLLKKEIAEKCFYNLRNEIYLLNPKVVISFGAISTNMILEKKEKLSSIHGKFFDINYTYSNNESRNFKLVPIFHPEFLLINPNMKRSAWLDMKKVMEYFSQVL